MQSSKRLATRIQDAAVRREFNALTARGIDAPAAARALQARFRLGSLAAVYVILKRTEPPSGGGETAPAPGETKQVKK